MRQSAGRLAAGVLLTGLWGLVSLPGAAQGIYTCVDARGRKLTADRPIPECLDREQTVLNPSGTVKAKVGPALTERERVAQAADAKKQAEQQNQQAAMQRRDRALLTRFPNQAAHDRERVEVLAQVRLLIAGANGRIEALQRQRETLEQELEFYKKDPAKAPAALRRQVEENDKSLVVQRRFIASQESEIRRLTARFDEERARLQKLWASEASASGTAPRKTR
jgi:chromosome segregation ATPase